MHNRLGWVRKNVLPKLPTPEGTKVAFHLTQAVTAQMINQVKDLWQTYKALKIALEVAPIPGDLVQEHPDHKVFPKDDAEEPTLTYMVVESNTNFLNKKFNYYVLLAPDGTTTQRQILWGTLGAGFEHMWLKVDDVV